MAMSPWVSASCWAVLGGNWEQILHCTTQGGSEVTNKFSQSNNNTERGLRSALTPAFNTVKTSLMSLRISLEKSSPPNEYCHNPSFWTSTSVSEVRTAELGSAMLADKCPCLTDERIYLYLTAILLQFIWFGVNKTTRGAAQGGFWCSENELGSGENTQRMLTEYWKCLKSAHLRKAILF